MANNKKDFGINTNLGTVSSRLPTFGHGLYFWRYVHSLLTEKRGVVGDISSL